jgi:hypothetical protein
VRRDHAGDLDLDDQVVTVLGKGRRPRVLAYGRKTALALDRYLRVRAAHPHSGLPNLWIGRNGAMTSSGVFRSSPTVGRRSVYLACIHISCATRSPPRGLLPGHRG